MRDKKGRTDSIIAFALIGLLAFMAFSANKGTAPQAASNDGAANTAAANTAAANTVKIVGAPCTQATTLTSSIVRRYTEVAQTAQNVTILQNNVLKGTIAHASTTTVQSGVNGDTLELFPGLESTTFYPRHFKGVITTCTGSATTGDAQYFTEVDDETVGGPKIKYDGIGANGVANIKFAPSPNKLVQIDTAPTITVENLGQASQNTGRAGQNLTIGAGGSASVRVKYSVTINTGYGVNGNILACQYPSAVYDATNPIVVTMDGANLDESSVKPSLIQYELIAGNNTIKAFKFPGMDGTKRGDYEFTAKATAATNNNPSGILDRINCTLADVSIYQREKDGAYVLDIEDRDQNTDLGGSKTTYDFEVGVE